MNKNPIGGPGSAQEESVSACAKDIVEGVFEKAKNFGRQEFAMEIERILDHARGSKRPAVSEIRGAIERELRKAV